MNLSPDQGKLGDKLMGPVSAILDQHRAELLPLLGKSGELSQAALRNDETVRSVATFCYALLPGLVRLAVKEPAFISFVMNNRETVLEKLVSRQEKISE